MRRVVFTEYLPVFGAEMWLLMAVLLCFVTGCCEGGVSSRDLASIESVLQEGDLVFRRGGGITSHAVLAADKGGTYSHTGIVVMVPREGLKVVHIVPGERDADGVKDRIKIESPEQFFASGRALEGAVMRVAGEEPVRAARRALALSETGLVFDHGYDLDDTTRMYCTELVYHVFMREGLDITDGKRSRINAPGFSGDYILPTDIQRNPRVVAVYRF